MKYRSLFVILMVLTLIISACAPAASPTADAPVEVEQPEAPAEPSEEVEQPDVSVEPEVVAVQNPNAPDFEYVADADTVFDLSQWYQDVGVDAAIGIRNPGAVLVPDEMSAPLPKANEKYKIGFSVYYTVDEVGSMILESMKAAALETGSQLSINAANYDQNAQKQAIEQWIQQGVVGVILAPCDFNGVKTALYALEKAGIPVISMNAPLAGNVDSVVTGYTVDQGAIAGSLLEQALLDAGTEMKGTIVYQTLPFVHPNAATRAKGFVDTFAGYPDITVVELTGISPEEHYTAFDGALKAYPDMIGAWGLYSSATIGMMNAKEANNRSDILLSSVDQDKPILKGIYDGIIVGTAAYSSIAPANWCMSQMVNLLNGAPIPGVMFYSNMAITQDNVVEAFEYYYPGKTLQDYIDGKVQ